MSGAAIVRGRRILRLRGWLKETLDAGDDDPWVEAEERTVEGDMSEDTVLEEPLTIWIIIRLRYWSVSSSQNITACGQLTIKTISAARMPPMEWPTRMTSVVADS